MKRLVQVVALSGAMVLGLVACGGSSGSSSAGSSDATKTTEASASPSTTGVTPTSAAGDAGEDMDTAEPVTSAQGFSTVVPGGRKNSRWSAAGSDGTNGNFHVLNLSDNSQITVTKEAAVANDAAALDAALQAHQKEDSPSDATPPQSINVGGEQGRSSAWSYKNPIDATQTVKAEGIVVTHNGQTLYVLYVTEPPNFTLDMPQLNHFISAWKWTS